MLNVVRFEFLFWNDVIFGATNSPAMYVSPKKYFWGVLRDGSAFYIFSIFCQKCVFVPIILALCEELSYVLPFFSPNPPCVTLHPRGVRFFFETIVLWCIGIPLCLFPSQPMFNPLPEGGGLGSVT